MNLFVKYYAFLAAWAIFGGFAIYLYLFGRRLRGEKKTIRGLFEYTFPLEMWKSRSIRMDIIIFIVERFFGSVHFVFSVAFPTLVVAWLSTRIDYSWLPHMNSSILIMIMMSIFLIIMVDLGDYISHFLQHFIPVLWELHKVHHSAIFLMPLTTRRTHLFGEIFDELMASIFVIVPLSIFQAMFHFTVPEMFAMIAAANAVSAIVELDSLRHSHLPVGFGPFDRVLISPHMHQLHHSSKIAHWDKNFGHRFSVWDWRFGTIAVPGKDEEFSWGLGKPEQDEYNTIFGAYVGPLVKIARLIGGKPIPDSNGGFIQQDANFFRRVLWRSPSDTYAKQRMLNLTPSAATGYGSAE